MDNMIAVVEQCIRENIRANIIGLIVGGVDIEREGYTEWTVLVAWERKDQCGTHRVQVNTDGESMAVSGHYDMNSHAAIADLLTRAGISGVKQHA